jgi:hypothetical protein
MKKICFQCGEEITPENDGISINDGEFYQCDDCHYIEYDCHIWPLLLVFYGEELKNKK